MLNILNIMVKKHCPISKDSENTGKSRKSDKACSSLQNKIENKEIELMARAFGE